MMSDLTIEFSKTELKGISYYDRLLKDLHALEANTENLSSCLVIKFESLKFHVSYLIPYLNLHPASSIATEKKTYDEWLHKDLGAVEVFFDNELGYLRGKMYGPCIFYAGEYLGSPELKFVERVRDHLECVEFNLSVSINEFLRVFEERSKELYAFRYLVGNYKFLDLILSSERLSHIFDVTELLPEKVGYMFEKFINVGDEAVLQEIGDYLDTIKSAHLQAEMVYLEVLQVLGVGQIYSCCFECETLCYFIDDLETIIERLMDDVPSLMKLKKIRDIQMELKFIRSVAKRVFIQSLEDRCWIVDAISTHVDVWAANFIDALDVSGSFSLVNDFRYHEGKTEMLKDAQEKISGARNRVRKIKSTDTSISCVDDFLKNFKLLVGDSVLTCPSTKNQLRELEFLHTLLQDTENLIRLNGELTNMCQHIKQVFREGLWDLRSHWFRRCRKHCPVFLEELTSQMLNANGFLVTLINSISTLLVNVESDGTAIAPVRQYAEIFIQEVTILRCIHINLQTQYWKEEESANLSEDIKVVATEAMSTYSLLLKHLDGDIRSSIVETVECFEASVRQAYLKFLELPPSDLLLSNSEVMFHEMLGHLKEFKERGVVEWTVHQVGVLYDSLGVCSSFLSRHIFKNDEPEEVMHIMRTQIIKMGRKVENLIEAFEMIPNCFFETWLFDLIEEVKTIKEEVSKISIIATAKMEAGLSHAKAHKETKAIEDKAGFGDEHNYPATTQDLMLSFEEQENQLRRQLTVGPQQRDVISIVGMPGIGKTTLALNVYYSCTNFFHARAWCYVSQDFQRKALLQNIVSQINGQPSSNQMGEEDLANELRQILLNKKNYLIVLDDIWDIKAWTDLKQCFPAGSNRSRILVTSRYKTVALELNCDKSSCLELGLLDANNSWRLLLNRVFGARICPPRLHEVGKVIANRCKGLPLSIVVIAGILKNSEMTPDKWNEVAESLESHFVINQDWVSSKLELSYNQLSIPLKICFLYCGALVKGKEIQRSKLVQLWCAERFFEDSHQQHCQERVAEKYLSDLVGRSLLMVAKTGFDNRIRTYRIHDLLGDFAIQKATEDKFLVSTNRCTYFTSLQRRLYLTCFPFELGASEHSVAAQSLVHSLFITTGLPEYVPYPHKAIARFFGHFKSLFILDLENIDLSFSVDNDFYKSVGDMKGLRYFAVQNSLKSIPSSFGELLNLETLIVRSVGREIEVPDIIFNLSKLRHLLFYRARVNDSKGTNNLCSSLQSFATPYLYGHTAHRLFAQLPNLIKLRCMFHDESIDLSILTCLQKLESLKVFYCGVDPYPLKLSFPSSLRKLMLSEFSLPWSEMDRTAALLPRLEKLKLLCAAFDGETWNTSGRFRNLKFFSLEELNIRKWKASDDNFPSLERLILRQCRALVSIPKVFGKIVNLNGIEIYNCDPSVAKSAMNIKRMQIDDGNMQFEAIVRNDDEIGDNDNAQSDDGGDRIDHHSDGSDDDDDDDDYGSDANE